MRHLTRRMICARSILAICVAATAIGTIITTSGMATMRRIPQVFFVDEDATAGANDGTSWTDAYLDLQDALDDGELGSGDDIWVAEGTYYPTSGTVQTISFVLKNGIEVYGGFDATETSRSQRDPDTNVTTLSGDIDATNGTSSDDSQHVVTASRNTAATVLDGFTITSGYADGPPTFLDWHGGGILIKSCSNFTIADCTFDFNHADNSGGAVAVWLTSNGPSSSATTISDCEFTDNDSDDTGGALRFANQQGTGAHNITIEDSNFTDNEIPTNDGGAENGGAVAITGANLLTIDNCVFTDNFAHDYAGALYAAPHGANPLRKADIIDCTFDGNTTDPDNGNNGGAVYMTDVGVGFGSLSLNVRFSRKRTFRSSEID